MQGWLEWLPTFRWREKCIPLVSRRKTYEHALPPEASELVAQGRVTSSENAGIKASAERKIHSVNYELPSAFIEICNGVQSFNDPAVSAITIVVEHFETIQCAPRRHSIEINGTASIFKLKLAGYDTCYVCAVTVSVKRVEPRRSWVHADRCAAPGAVPLSGHILMFLEMRMVGANSAYQAPPNKFLSHRRHSPS